MMRENGMRNTHGALIALTLLGIHYVFFNFDLAQATHTDPVENRLGRTASDTLLSYNQTVIVINGNQLVAYLASSSEQKSLGLSVMENLTEDHAMLFLFRNLEQHAFWMKDMKFSIDIIWIDSDRRVVHIEHSLTPCAADAKCSVYSPEVESLYVLETVAGYAIDHDINIGESISIGNSGLLLGGGDVACQKCPINPSEPYLRSADMTPLRPASIGMQMMIATNMQHNIKAERMAEFVAMIEVRDSDGVTQFLAWQSSSLSVEKHTEMAVLWTPLEPGEYELRAFAITDLDNPLILSTIKSSVWNIL